MRLDPAADYPRIAAATPLGAWQCQPFRRECRNRHDSDANGTVERVDKRARFRDVDDSRIAVWRLTGSFAIANDARGGAPHEWRSPCADKSYDQPDPEAMTSGVTAVSNMSVYNSLDEGIPSEVHVYDIAHKRRDAPKIELPEPSFSQGDVAAARKASPANEPLAATFRWVAGLPLHLRPLALLQKYPRIANRLANSARDPAAMRAYLFELLIDMRGGRNGFPHDVQAELLVLRAHFDASNVQVDPRG